MFQYYRITGEIRNTLFNNVSLCRRPLYERNDTFHDKQSQIAERKTGDGRGPGDCSKEAA